MRKKKNTPKIRKKKTQNRTNWMNHPTPHTKNRFFKSLKCTHTYFRRFITDGSEEHQRPQQNIRSKRARRPPRVASVPAVREPDQRIDNDQMEEEESPDFPKVFLSPSVKEYLELGKSIPGNIGIHNFFFQLFTNSTVISYLDSHLGHAKRPSALLWWRLKYSTTFFFKKPLNKIGKNENYEEESTACTTMMAQFADPRPITMEQQQLFFWFFSKKKKLHYLTSSNDDYVSVGRVLDAATRSMHTQCAEAGVGMDDVCVVVLL